MSANSQSNNQVTASTASTVRAIAPSVLALSDALNATLSTPFTLEGIQNLSAEQTRLCQAILGHGETLGVWKTPSSRFEQVPPSHEAVDLERRIRAHLNDDALAHPGLHPLLEEAKLYLTRYAILLITGPASAKAKGQASMKATTVAQLLYQYLSETIAQSIVRRLEAPATQSTGFVSALTVEELKALRSKRGTASELQRFERLTARGLWADAPQQIEFEGRTTPVRGQQAQPSPTDQSVPWQPLPDEYMEEIGPRLMWVIKDMGPNLIHLLEHLTRVQTENEYKNTVRFKPHIEHYFKHHTWRDRNQGDLTHPPFALHLSAQTGSAAAKEAVVWPPREWADVMSLVATLQRSHQFMTLLLLAPRASEVATLKRDCLDVAADGNIYFSGKTFKPTSIAEGRDRKWMAPSILVHSISQQVKLLESIESLCVALNVGKAKSKNKKYQGKDLQTALGNPTHLWAEVGSAGNNPLKRLRTQNLDSALQSLAESLDVSPKPGGVNVHAHRLRKTMARLAGITLDGAQKVLMVLLGHEDVTTTLGYMQSDPGFQAEVLDVVREIRIIRMTSTLEELRNAAMQAPQGAVPRAVGPSSQAALTNAGHLPNAGYGGGGVAPLLRAIANYEKGLLHQRGDQWGANSARELAIMLTDNGEYAQLVAPGVMCTKAKDEIGLCNQKGEISPSNCQVKCLNHVELATGRRDVQRVIPILVEQINDLHKEGVRSAAYHSQQQLLKELEKFDDIGQEFKSKADVKAVLELDLQWGE